MKALTALQPWASLLIFGEKRFETRSWQTAHRGKIAIYAGLRRTDSARDLCTIEPFRSALARHGIKHFTDLPKGVIIGTIDLTGCMPVEAATKYMHAGPSPEHGGFNTAQEEAFGDFRPGRWAWQLCSPSPLAVPIPFRGRLGLIEEVVGKPSIIITLSGMAMSVGADFRTTARAPAYPVICHVTRFEAT